MGIRLVIDGNSVYEIDEDCQKGRPKSGSRPGEEEPAPTRPETRREKMGLCVMHNPVAACDAACVLAEAVSASAAA